MAHTEESSADRLLQAPLNEDPATLRQLLAAGHGIDCYDDVGATPLISAVFIGDPAAVELLLIAGANPNQPSKDGGTPLWHALDDFGLNEIADILARYGATHRVAPM